MNDAACMVNLVVRVMARIMMWEGHGRAYGQHFNLIASCFSRRALTSGGSSWGSASVVRLRFFRDGSAVSWMACTVASCVRVM